MPGLSMPLVIDMPGSAVIPLGYAIYSISVVKATTNPVMLIPKFTPLPMGLFWCFVLFAAIT